jgi:hypothetical protein
LCKKRLRRSCAGADGRQGAYRAGEERGRKTNSLIELKARPGNVTMQEIIRDCECCLARMVESRALTGHFFERDDIVTFCVNFDIEKQREGQRAGRREVKIRQ